MASAATVGRRIARLKPSTTRHLCPASRRQREHSQSSVQNAAPRPSRATKLKRHYKTRTTHHSSTRTVETCVSSHQSLSLQQCTLWHRCETPRRPVNRFVAYMATGDIVPRRGRRMAQILCKRGAAARDGALEASCGRAPTARTARDGALEVFYGQVPTTSTTTSPYHRPMPTLAAR